MASLLMRMEDTKNMWPHMNRPSARPEALCARSMRAGQRLLRERSARPTPAITSVLFAMVWVWGLPDRPLRTLAQCANRHWPREVPPLRVSPIRGAHRLDEIPLPVRDQTELIAEGLAILLIENRGARAEPEALQEEGSLEGRAIVDGDIVFRLVGRLPARGWVDGVPAPHEIEIPAQALDERLEIVRGTDQHGLLSGAVEVLVDHREVARKGAPWRLDGVAGARDREGSCQRQIAVDRLDARSAGLRRPVELPARRGQQRVADREL